MPTYQITAPDGVTYKIDGPEGATQEQVAAKVQEMIASRPKAPDSREPGSLTLSDLILGRGRAPAARTTIEEIGRQVALTGRAGITGLANTVGILSNPIASALNLAGMGADKLFGTNIGARFGSAADAANTASNTIGLSKPETAQERYVQDGASLMAGAGSSIGLANLAARSAPAVISQVAPTTAFGRASEAATAREMGKFLGASPAQQIGAAAGSGLAGGVTREQGGGGGEQFAASLLGGIAGGAGANAAVNYASRPRGAIDPQQLEIRLSGLMRERGIDWSALPESVRASVRQDAARAAQGGGLLNPDAIARAADYRAVRGAQPTRGTLTQNPVLLTQEKNTAKAAANMNDPALHALPMREAGNNRALIENLGDVSRQQPASAFERAGPIINSLDRQYSRGQAAIGDLYTAARNTEGRYAQLDPAFFNQRVNTLLDESMTGGALPGGVRDRINALAQGQHPFDVNYVEQFKTQVGKLQRGATDGQTRMALGQVRQALEETPLLDGQGQGAIDAFNRARMLNRTVESAIERNPAMGFVRQASRDGVNPAPDSFVDKFILGKGATADSVRTLARSLEGDPAAKESARAAIVDHLRNKAKIAEDGAGNFSAAGYNGELFKLGKAKLGEFFSREEVEQLHAIGRVARYETSQPRGSAVGNSNAGAVLTGLLSKLASNPIVGALPFGREVIGGPAANISVRLGNGAALDTSGLMRLPANTGPSGYSAGAPALTAGMLGLLGAQPPDERQYR